MKLSFTIHSWKQESWDEIFAQAKELSFGAIELSSDMNPAFFEKSGPFHKSNTMPCAPTSQRETPKTQSSSKKRSPLQRACTSPLSVCLQETLKTQKNTFFPVWKLCCLLPKQRA